MNSLTIKEKGWINLELKNDLEGFDVTFQVYEGAGHGNYDASEAIKTWLNRYGSG